MSKIFNKSDLIEALAQEHKISVSTAKIGVETFFNEIVHALEKKHSVQIRGFGSFELRHYKAYKGKNPKNNETIQVKAKKMPFFKVSSLLKKEIN